MNNGLVGGRSSETQSHPIYMIIIIILGLRNVTSRFLFNVVVLQGTKHSVPFLMRLFSLNVYLF
jgi:hypothetical protein